MKKVLVVASVAVLLICAFALTVNAEECVHKDNWELKFGSDGLLGSWEAINVCEGCNTVLNDEFCAPLVVSRGYSYFEESFSQGYSVNREMIDKYERYSGDKFDFGLVAGVSDKIGFTPVNANGEASQDKGIVFNFTKTSTSLLDIKVVNVPTDNKGTKIVACLYAIRGGEVIYVDGDRFNKNAVGVTYNEVVDAVDNGGIPSGLEEYRKLTAEEMEILFGCYWYSTSSTVRQYKNNTPENFASTRMLSRAELPEGSYAVVGSGWAVRPEIWKTDADGNVVKSSERHKGQGSGTYQLSTWWRDSDTAQSDYKYMAFNISAEKSGYLTQGMTPEGIADALQIYVPATTKVAKNEYAATKDVSVEGMQLLEWTTDNYKKSSYWFSTSSATSTSSDAKFYATCQFTKETLPVGSVIEINEGWMYRAENWKTEGQIAGSRGPLVTTYRIVVTEDFWQNVAVRGFNISKTEGGSLSSYSFDEVADAFKIYVPVN